MMMNWNKRRLIPRLLAAWSVPLWVGGTAGMVALIPATSASAQTVSTENVRVAETEVGNLVADAVRSAGGAEIAIIPAAAFKQRATAPKEASGEQIAALLEQPTDDIVILSLRGAQILAALERSVSFAPQPSSGFLQVSGLRFSYDIGKAGGKRVNSVALTNGTLDAARIYKVATTRPLANGQQGYFQIWDKEQIAGDVKKSIADALISEQKKARGGVLSASIENRITQASK